MKVSLLAFSLLLLSCQQRSVKPSDLASGPSSPAQKWESTPQSTTTDDATQNAADASNTAIQNAAAPATGGQAGASSKVVYRPLGTKAGGYQAIKTAKWPDVCVKGDVVNTTGPLFPFNEKQTLVVRGPLIMTDLNIYTHQKAAKAWTRQSDLNAVTWKETDYGTAVDRGKFPATSKVLENGRELYTPLADGGEKLIVMRIQMPHAAGAPYSAVAQNDVPAVWLLNTKIFEAPSAQYFCNCRGLGNPGGCGEIDIAEIIPEKKEEVSTTLYSYEGAVGGVLPSKRPTSNFLVYTAVLRNDGDVGEVAILESQSFDFTQATLSEDFVAKDWLGAAKIMNPSAQRLNPPP